MRGKQEGASKHTADRSRRKCEEGNESDSGRRQSVSLAAAEAETAVVVAEEGSYTTEFRAYNDDAWYSVRVTMEGKQTLRVRYQNFSEEQDNLFEPTHFESLEELQEFRERFRPVSKQLQDNECRQLVQGVRVCACHSFSPDDVRFYDAVVDGVQESKHSCKRAEELCSCTFILFWLHGPNAGNLTATTIENVCIVQPASELDPAVVAFLEMASSCAIFEPGSLEVSCLDGRMEDREFEGKRNVCMILMGNLDRELCPSTVIEFLHRHTLVSAGVFIFPCLSSEIYTRGAIMLDSEKDFQKLCDFLTNPNYIITSSTGRPWVIIQKLVGLKKIKASIGTLVPISKNESHSGKNGTRNNLKVVFSGTQEFKIASALRDLFLEFSDHQERLHKKLALLERSIYATRSFDELT